MLSMLKKKKEKKEKRRGVGVNWLMILFPRVFRKPLLSIAYFLFCASNWKPYQVKQRHFKAKTVNVYLQSGKEQALLSTFFKKKDGKIVSQFLPGIETQPRAGQLSITPLFVAMLICTNTPRSSATRQTWKVPQFFWCREHPETLITQVWGRAERGARHPGEKCIVYLCILKNASPSASSLISDIPHDMTDALKARIRHHLLFGVNLKVAALWMSTPPHVDLFKCHRSLFCDCETGQTKGGWGGYGGRENTLAVFFFFFPTRGNPNDIQSARLSRGFI